MKRISLLLLAALILGTLLATTALAAESKSVSYKSGDETVQALLYTPSGKGPFPAIIVIHERSNLAVRAPANIPCTAFN
jgi:hypothetical protein